MWGQVAIPVVPTVRVVVTFTKFVELQSVEQFFTPLSSPRHFLKGSSEDDDKKSDTHYSSFPSSSSWLRRSSSQSAGKQQRSSLSSSSSSSAQQHWETDPFAIPSGYTWTSIMDDKSGNKMRRSKSTRKTK